VLPPDVEPTPPLLPELAPLLPPDVDPCPPLEPDPEPLPELDPPPELDPDPDADPELDPCPPPDPELLEPPPLELDDEELLLELDDEELLLELDDEEPPLELDEEPPARSLAPLGVPMPVGPSQPGPLVQRTPQPDVFESVVEPPLGTGYADEPTSLNAEAWLYAHPRLLERVAANLRRARMPATSGAEALVPSTGIHIPVENDAIASSSPPLVNVAAAEMSAVARFAQPLPARTLACQASPPYSVLQPLVVTSWSLAAVPNVPSSQTPSP
jgi:hypothetical protein